MCKNNRGLGLGLSSAVSAALLIMNTGCVAPENYAVGGDVAGVEVSGGVVSLSLNSGAEVLDVGIDGAYVFSTPFSDGDPYEVLIAAEPTDYSCTITPNNSAVIDASSVIDIDVSCTVDLYSVSGTVTGLQAGQTLTLVNSDTGELLAVSGENFSFVTQQENNTPYSIAVDTQPAVMSCAVTAGGTGSISSADVSGIEVSCQYNDWLTGSACNGTNFGGGCVAEETGYHYRGSFNGYACWWHTKNQAWNTTTSSNYSSLAGYFGFDATLGVTSWCHAFADEPNPAAGYSDAYNDLGDIGAWGWCGGGAPMLSGGFICYPQ